VVARRGLASAKGEPYATSDGWCDGAGARAVAGLKAPVEPDEPEWAVEELLEGIRNGLTMWQAAEAAGLNGKEVSSWSPTSELGQALDAAVRWRNEHHGDWPTWGRRYRRTV
jgi:hypothetical protein